MGGISALLEVFQTSVEDEGDTGEHIYNCITSLTLYFCPFSRRFIRLDAERVWSGSVGTERDQTDAADKRKGVGGGGGGGVGGGYWGKTPAPPAYQHLLLFTLLPFHSIDSKGF